MNIISNYHVLWSAFLQHNATLHAICDVGPKCEVCKKDTKGRKTRILKTQPRLRISCTLLKARTIHNTQVKTNSLPTLFAYEVFCASSHGAAKAFSSLVELPSGILNRQ